MSSFMLTAGFAVALFAVFMLAMAVGLFVRGLVLRGGCHSQSMGDGSASCGACGGDRSACRRQRRQGGKSGDANAS